MMNHSINYSGFIDLAMEASTLISSTASNCNTENCQPALAMQLHEDYEIEQLKHGAVSTTPSSFD